MARSSFVERSLFSFVGILEHAGAANEFARRNGLLQRLDPRVKLLGFLAFLVTVVSVRKLAIVVAIFFLVSALALVSRIPLRVLAVRTWLPVALFTGVIALPAVFLTPGLALRPGLTIITSPGLRSAAFLVSRAETAATCMLILILSTDWARLLKALRVLRLPRAFVIILGMTQRYIFLLLRLANDLFEARRSRIVAPLDSRARRRLAAANASVLISRSLDLSDQVYRAMLSRGFRGDVLTLKPLRFRPNDWLALALFLTAAGLFFWAGVR